MIDSHCHIGHIKGKQKDLVERALKNGITQFVNVSCQLSEVPTSLELSQKYDFIWSTIGIHPTLLSDNMEDDLKKVEEIAKREEKIVAIGEIGLDYYHDKFPHEIQREFFRKQLEISKILEIPAIIHCRSSKDPGENGAVFKDAFEDLESENISNAVMHCFSGNMDEAKRILDLGLIISFAGIITYKKNQKLQEVVKYVPLERILLETDSPYLTVEEKKGQAGEPADLKRIAEKIAEIKGTSFEKVAEITHKNTKRFFGI